MAQAAAKHGENHAHGHDHGHHDPQEMKILGFGFFLISDVILFSVVFATFIVLRDNTAGGPILSELIKMPGVIAETFLLLTSSFTSGLAVLAMNQGKVKQLINWLIVTAVLGAGFLALDL
jgi:cytochrome o ubiquinol oxidase subunit 3